MATAPSTAPLVPRSTSPFVAPERTLNHLPLVQPPPQQTQQNHPSPLHQSSSQPPLLTSPALISTVVSAVASTASFSTSAVTQAVAAPISVPRALKESNNVPFSLSHLSPSTPVCIPNLVQELMNHPDCQFASDLVHDLQFGCRIGYQGPRHQRITPNLKPTLPHPDAVTEALLKEVSRGPSHLFPFQPFSAHLKALFLKRMAPGVSSRISLCLEVRPSMTLFLKRITPYIMLPLIMPQP